MIYEDMTQEDVDSILDGDFSCETTEDLYELSDDVQQEMKKIFIPPKKNCLKV